MQAGPLKFNDFPKSKSIGLISSSLFSRNSTLVAAPLHENLVNISKINCCFFFSSFSTSSCCAPINSPPPPNWSFSLCLGILRASSIRSKKKRHEDLKSFTRKVQNLPGLPIQQSDFVVNVAPWTLHWYPRLERTQNKHASLFSPIARSHKKQTQHKTPLLPISLRTCLTL